MATAFLGTSVIDCSADGLVSFHCSVLSQERWAVVWVKAATATQNNEGLILDTQSAHTLQYSFLGNLYSVAMAAWV